MTRFARAKGSKSSNERVPEQATSWSEMRRDLHRESVRKAAEEQIQRESHREIEQNFRKTLLDKFVSKAKPKEPVELVPFDHEPRLNGHLLQTSLHPKISDLKPTKKINSQGFPRKEKPQFNSRESSSESIAEQSLSDLVSFDDEPRFNSHLLQMPVCHKESDLKKPPEEIKRQGVSRKEKLQFNSQESSSKSIAEQSLFKTHIDQSVNLESLLGQSSSSSQIPEPVILGGHVKSKEFNPKVMTQKGTDRPSLLTSNKRKLQNQNRPSRKQEEEDSEPKIGGNFKGYPVPVEDAETLTDAYNILRKEGLTHKQAMDQIKPERRRAEKRLARLKSMICFRCRKPGHRLSDCPMEDIDCDVCFKCGSTTHKYQECKKKGSFVNAKCFICGVVGHLSAQCPENAHGVYPEGGECKICGEKSHLVKDCPQNKNKKDHHPGITEFDDYFDDEKPSETIEPKKKKIKKVQF